MLSQREKNILDLLKQDSRQPIKKIAKATNTKPSTVYQTIRRLQANGTIERFTLVLNDKKVNRNFTVFMLITTSRNLEDDFFSNECIDEVFGVNGEYNLLLKMKFADVEAFNNFLIEFRKKKYIVKTLTMVATVKIKEF